jgi:hypothetical protein
MTTHLPRTRGVAPPRRRMRRHRHAARPKGDTAARAPPCRPQQALLHPGQPGQRLRHHALAGVGVVAHRHRVGPRHDALKVLPALECAWACVARARVGVASWATQRRGCVPSPPPPRFPPPPKKIQHTPTPTVPHPPTPLHILPPTHTHARAHRSGPSGGTVTSQALRLCCRPSCARRCLPLPRGCAAPPSSASGLAVSPSTCPRHEGGGCGWRQTLVMV